MNCGYCGIESASRSHTWGDDCIRLLKAESARKDEKILELMEEILRLQDKLRSAAAAG